MTETAGPAPSGEKPASKHTRSLAQAVATALVLLGLIALCAYLGKPAFFVLILVVITIAQFELYDGLTQSGHKIVTVYGLAAGVGLMIGAFLESIEVVAIVLVVGVLGSFVLALRPTRGPTPASDVAWTILGLVWVAGGGAAATAILMLRDGLGLLIAFVLVTAIGDIGAYFLGVQFGRHKMAPSISAAKSWEGFAAQVPSAIGAGAVASLVVDRFDMIEGLGLGLICGLLGPAGDLSESLFKREIGIKDSGRLLPGHGGLLDRLDAIVFVAPAAYLYFLYVLNLG
jgi:phosphatidate cytidylyltransferase